MEVRRLRRVFQVLVLAVLVAVPLYSQNPIEWAPSRIAMGELPPPRVSRVWGDTWSFSFYGFTVTHPLAALEAMLAAKVVYLPLLAAALLPLAITLLLGRVFCSWICPAGFLLELNQRLGSFLSSRGVRLSLRVADYRYHLLGFALLLSFFFATPVVSAFDLPHVLGREIFYVLTYGAPSYGGLLLLTGVVLLEALAARRIWCRSLCPAGGFLSLLGAKRVVRISKRMERCIFCGECNIACPYGLRPVELGIDKDFNDRTCDNCGLCRDACPTGALYYAVRR
ncbi:MAG: 4Fe-4S binding protein [Euryarchaeota archaeon]|nr:4Fe-4S binding protein [Euryarchaeota archaeon]